MNEREYYALIEDKMEKKEPRRIEISDSDGYCYLHFSAKGGGFDGKVCADMMAAVREECRKRIDKIDGELERI